MNQTAPQEPNPDTAKSADRRIATRDLVRILQRWERRARRPEDRVVVVIYNVHRAAREVVVYRDGDDHLVKGALFHVGFADLRQKYRLITNETLSTTERNV